jgi:anti-anti-sigma factor
VTPFPPRIDVAERGDAVVVAVSGEVDLSNVAEIREQVLSAVSNSSRGLVVDLTTTAYIDSQGIKMLLDLAYRLGVRRQKMHLVVPEGSLLKSLLTLVAVPKAIPTSETVDEALTQMRAS